MAQKILLKRGTKQNLPLLDVGEPAFCTDTGELYVGGDGENVKMATHTRLNQLGTNVEDFGAVGDGTFDNTQPFMEALQAVGIGGKVIVPVGTYKITGSLTIPESVILEGMGEQTTILFDGDRTISYFISCKRNSQLANIKVKSTFTSWNTSIHKTGVLIKDSDMVVIRGVTIEGFERGIDIFGENAGASYNAIYPVMIRNCMFGVYIESAGSGWANENSIYGGRFAVDTDWRDNASYGVYITQRGANVINNNKLIGVSIEGHGTCIHVEGMYNTVISPRFETVGTGVYVEFQGNAFNMCRYNTIYKPYGIVNPGNITNLDQDGQPIIDNWNTIDARGYRLLIQDGVMLNASRTCGVRYTSGGVSAYREETGEVFFTVRDNGTGNDYYNYSANNFRLENGTSAKRPVDPYTGTTYFDTTVGKPIFWDGTKWVDSQGVSV